MCHFHLSRASIPTYFTKLMPLLALLLLQAAFPSLSAATSIKVGGSGSGLGPLQVLGAAFAKRHPDFTVAVTPSMGSSGGIKALQAGALDISISSRPLAADEASSLNGYLVAKTPFILGTHKGSPYQNISTRQLLDFYSGAVTIWPNGQPVRLILRPAKESDNVALQQFSPGMENAVSVALARTGLLVAFSDQDAADALEKQAGSLGPSTLALVLSEKRAIKPLAYNGVTPSVKALKDGSYPYYKPIYLVTKSAPSPLIKEFVDFILSPAGSQILTRNGLLPVTP